MRRFVYKFDNSQLPIIFDVFYTKARAMYSGDTRTDGELCWTNTKVNVQKHWMKFDGTTIWNIEIIKV